MPRHAGYVAIVGRPNVGKSTLINRIAGSKSVAVSKVPQTTRLATRAIWTKGENQVVFVDLPGYAKPRTLLGDRLNKSVRREVAGADIILMMVDGAAGVGKGDRYILAKVCNWGIPIVCVVNKSDTAGRARTAKALADSDVLAQKLAGVGFPGFADYFPISASEGDGVDELLLGLAKLSPEGPFLFDADTTFDVGAAGVKGQIGEIIREKLIGDAREELPYSIAVLVDDIAVRAENEKLIDVSAKVLVERESQKGIVIGTGGETIKKAGVEARPEIESLLGSKIFLDLRVVVQSDWQRDPKALGKLGY